MRYVFVTGIQHDGETIQEMDRRDKAMQERHRLEDDRIASEARQRREPMEAMREWAKERNILQTHKP